MTMDMQAEKDIVVVENGKQVKKRVAAVDQASGEVIIYTISYRNEGKEAATNVVLDNKIPDGTVYVNDSSKAAGAETLFSVDNGKTYKQPASLTYEITDKDGKKQQVKATPEQYTDIRWVVAKVPPGSGGQIVYELRVK